jgi:hypothetical protein
MAAIPQVSVDVHDIDIDYNESTGAVTVTPTWVDKNTTVRFKNPKGGKLRIVFLSPTGKETDTVLDSELCTLSVGGTYHFKCFFTPSGAKNEISPKSGGVIDVVPQRP